jgi:hypothetical protein
MNPKEPINWTEVNRIIDEILKIVDLPHPIAMQKIKQLQELNKQLKHELRQSN